LRKPEIQFPPDFDMKEKAAEAELIRRLMDHNPKNRPSALDLLSNKNMPPKMEGR
jgi:translation initiation factor 2-alpha kinase 4